MLAGQINRVMPSNVVAVRIFPESTDAFCERTASFSVLEIITEINEVSVFNDTCVRWQINPGRTNSRMVYVVSEGIAFLLPEQEWEPKGTRGTGLGRTSQSNCSPIPPSIKKGNRFFKDPWIILLYILCSMCLPLDRVYVWGCVYIWYQSLFPNTPTSLPQCQPRSSC